MAAGARNPAAPIAKPVTGSRISEPGGGSRYDQARGEMGHTGVMDYSTSRSAAPGFAEISYCKFRSLTPKAFTCPLRDAAELSAYLAI